MSANVETMFCVGRQTPWHGLGRSIEAAPTSADALVAAGLDWKVIQQRVCLEDGSVILGQMANLRETDKKFLGIVSDSYKIVQNDEAFAFVDDLLGEGVRYETAGSLAGGKRVWMLARLPEDYKLLGDVVDPYFVITNTHDGTGAVRAAMTPVRVVCQNTLNLALDGAPRTWSTIHKGDFAGKATDARLTLGLADAYMKRLQAEAVELARIKLSDGKVTEFIQKLLPCDETASNRSWDNVNRKREDLYVRYYEAPDLQGLGGNGYRFMNAVTDFATHTAIHRDTKSYKENLFARTIDGNPFVNKALEMVREAA